MPDKAKEIISQFENSELRIQTEQHPNGIVVRLDGDLLLGESGALFMKKMRELAATPDVKKIVLDFGGVRYINSGGLGSLVSSFTSLRNAGKEVVLANLPKKISDLLQITKLYTVFPVFPSVEEGLASNAHS